MPIPFAPIAGAALKYGGAALAAYAVARSFPPGRRDQRLEDALDDLPEGVCAHMDRDRDGHGSRRAQVGGRLRRVIRLHGDAVGFEIDLSGLARLRLRRIA